MFAILLQFPPIYILEHFDSLTCPHPSYKLSYTCHKKYKNHPHGIYKMKIYWLLHKMHLEGKDIYRRAYRKILKVKLLVWELQTLTWIDFRAALIDLLAIERGIPPSSIPCGQRYLQKYGEAPPSSSVKNIPKSQTTKIKIKYLRYFRKVNFLVENFFVGILYKRSWKNPKGHIKPQISLPNRVPKKSISPVT